MDNLVNVPLIASSRYRPASLDGSDSPVGLGGKLSRVNTISDGSSTRSLSSTNNKLELIGNASFSDSDQVWEFTTSSGSFTSVILTAMVIRPVEAPEESTALTWTRSFATMALLSWPFCRYSNRPSRMSCWVKVSPVDNLTKVPLSVSSR